jgi:tetratricopeptide (TPR) repeat protein
LKNIIQCISLLVTLPLFLAASWSNAAETGSFGDDWNHLVMAGKYDQARMLCEGRLQHNDRVTKTEAHKCLANVELAGAEEGVLIEGNDAGGGALRANYTGAGVDRAIGHLNEAIKLSPGDVSVHQGRIYVLRASGRYGEIPGYLEKSVMTYKGADALEAWLGALAPLFGERHYHAALDSYKVLEKYNPGSHRVAANIGAVYTVLEKDNEALAYLKKAVDLAPDDPVNNWNLGRFYDFTDKDGLAEKYYLKSIALEEDADKRLWINCIFADFIEKKLGDMNRACALQKANCPEQRQTACEE